MVHRDEPRRVYNHAPRTYSYNHSRHHHYAPGYHLRELPHNHTRIWYRDRDYYYYGGAFFLHYDDGYRAVYAPIGARIRVLPHGYLSFYLGPYHYFYYDYTYYRWLPDSREYVVVEAPEGAREAIVSAAETELGELYVYPKNGQDAETQDRDRFECHLWAVEQTDYDPGAEDQDPEMVGDFQRALTACLEGRGYTVK